MATQIIVGPALELELGSVSTGPAAASVTKLSDTKQRLDLVIPAPTTDLVDAAQASANEAALARAAADAARVDASTGANSATASAALASQHQVAAAEAAVDSLAHADASALSAVDAAAARDALLSNTITAAVDPTNPDLIIISFPAAAQWADGTSISIPLEV